jgi:hypothetical protein
MAAKVSNLSIKWLPGFALTIEDKNMNPGFGFVLYNHYINGMLGRKKK